MGFRVVGRQKQTDARGTEQMRVSKRRQKKHRAKIRRGCFLGTYGEPRNEMYAVSKSKMEETVYRDARRGADRICQ